MLYRQIELIVLSLGVLNLRDDEALQLWWPDADQKSACGLKSLDSGAAAESVFVAYHYNKFLLWAMRVGNLWDCFEDGSSAV